MIAACQLAQDLPVGFSGFSSVAKARSGVDVEIQRREKKVGGSSGSFSRSMLFSICQSSTSSPLRSVSP